MCHSKSLCFYKSFSIALLVIIFASCFAVNAQTQRSPSDVVRDFYKAMHERRFKDARRNGVNANTESARHCRRRSISATGTEGGSTAWERAIPPEHRGRGAPGAKPRAGRVRLGGVPVRELVVVLAAGSRCRVPLFLKDI